MRGEMVHSAELKTELNELLHAPDPRSIELQRELKRLEREHGPAVYSELIHSLSHLRFSPAEARCYWQRILQYHAAMERDLGYAVDMRVALASYFLDIDRRLDRPKIVELRLFEQMQASAYRDELTGLHNYRYSRECLAREIARSRRSGSPLSLVMIDVDDFKLYNDREGHEEGNAALVRIASCLRGTLREGDVAVRYGGEEFALILASAAKNDARMVAETARQNVQAGTGMTVSLGVATYPADADGLNGLVRAADSAMYEAKAGGKNQTRLYGESCRSHRRATASLEGRFRRVAPDDRPLTTVTIGGGGILFRTDRPLSEGELVTLELSVPGCDTDLSATGRVVRVAPRPDGAFEIAVKFTEMTPTDRRRLERLAVS